MNRKTTLITVLSVSSVIATSLIIIFSGLTTSDSSATISPVGAVIKRESAALPADAYVPLDAVAPEVISKFPSLVKALNEADQRFNAPGALCKTESCKLSSVAPVELAVSFNLPTTEASGIINTSGAHFTISEREDNPTVKIYMTQIQVGNGIYMLILYI